MESRCRAESGETRRHRRRAALADSDGPCARPMVAISHPKPATGASAYVVAQNTSSAACRAVWIRPSPGIRQSSAISASSASPPQVATAANTRKRGGSTKAGGCKSSAPSGNGSQELAVLRHLIGCQAAKHHRRVDEPCVRQQGDAEKPAVHVIRRQHALPQDGHRERGREEPSTARRQRRGGRATRERQPDRQAPVGEQVDVVVRERPDDRDSRQGERRQNDPGDRRSPDGPDDQRQARRRQRERRDPPHVEWPQQEDDGRQLEDGVADAVLVTGRMQQSCPHGTGTCA